MARKFIIDQELDDDQCRQEIDLELTRLCNISALKFSMELRAKCDAMMRTEIAKLERQSREIMFRQGIMRLQKNKHLKD